MAIKCGRPVIVEQQLVTWKVEKKAQNIEEKNVYLRIPVKHGKKMASATKKLTPGS
jgi:hypothetical protein